MKKLLSIITLVMCVVFVGFSNSIVNNKDSVNSTAWINHNDTILTNRNTEIIKRCKNLFNYKKDEFSDKTWVKPKTAPRTVATNSIYCYFALDNNQKPNSFMFRYQYFGSDYLFIELLIFNIDGENFRILVDMNRDCGAFGDQVKVWEWCTVDVRNENLIQKLANAKIVKVKLVGDKYETTRKLTAAQIKSIKDTYEYYLALGGKF